MVAYSFQKRFVDPIRVGLSRISLSFDCPPKRQTIRAVGKRRHARPGETLQLYAGMRTRHCFKIGEAICTEVSPVIIWVDPRTIAIERAKVLLSRKQMIEFARADGFSDPGDMAAFWRVEHKGVEKFEGFLIEWRPDHG